MISPTNVASFPEGGGHFWVFMQYAQALRRLGCEVHWLERIDGRAKRKMMRAINVIVFAAGRICVQMAL